MTRPSDEPYERMRALSANVVVTESIDPATGAHFREAMLPVLASGMTGDDGTRSLAVTFDLEPFGGEKWLYDSVIAADGGQVTVLFFEDDDEDDE